MPGLLREEHDGWRRYEPPRPPRNSWSFAAMCLGFIGAAFVFSFAVWATTQQPAYEPYPTPRPAPTAPPVARLDAPIVPTYPTLDGLQVVIVATQTPYALPPTPTPLPLPTATPYQATVGQPDIGAAPGFWGTR